MVQLNAEDKQALADDLSRWWMDIAHQESEAVVDKAVEYGPNSMIGLGQKLARYAGKTVTDAEAIEIACFFYIEGKMGRWLDALVRGEQVSGDTPYDIGVYIRMVQRVRSNGSWPGTPTLRPVKWDYPLPTVSAVDVGLVDGKPLSHNVHDHGPDEGEGTSCPETVVPGLGRRGRCLLCPACGNYKDTPGHELGCAIGRGEASHD